MRILELGLKQGLDTIDQQLVDTNHFESTTII